METLTLNNGTVLENSTAIETSGMLCIYTRNGYTLRDLCDALFPPENISRITAVFPGGTYVYKGYNHLVSLRDEGNYLVTAILKKDGAE